MFGPFIITAISDEGKQNVIMHLVLEGSSQCILGKNVTNESEIMYMDINALKYRICSTFDNISMTEANRRSYVNLDHSKISRSDNGILRAPSGRAMDCKDWRKVKAVFDKVHNMSTNMLHTLTSS